ncbi:hypothetical protein [Salimicrobium halophilum]|uniref:Uncharacterized protein n=1 Tax=Salimicrobium halophilum TaxID=86666 RepID=A0A1G8PIS5_9BACI|nr:hypothetical protein [Salimicrobium halophilum]SDI92337.1 hypothetical protein SAMN04490247_0016 [Salimicrobium halophilum]
MSRMYRYRLPPWCRHGLFKLEKALLPITIYQIIRTLIVPTTLDVFLTGVFVCLYLAFYFKWI